jgi:hypothetical protein
MVEAGWGSRFSSSRGGWGLLLYSSMIKTTCLLLVDRVFRVEGRNIKASEDVRKCLNTPILSQDLS